MSGDPIEHAWRCCNPDATFPKVLTKAVPPSPLAYSLSGVGAILRAVVSIDDARRAAHSRVISKRVNGFSLRRRTRAYREGGAGF